MLVNTVVPNLKHYIFIFLSDTLSCDCQHWRLVLLRRRGRIHHALGVHGLQRALPVLEPVHGQEGDAVVVHERAGDHEAVEDLVAVELETNGGKRLKFRLRGFGFRSVLLTQMSTFPVPSTSGRAW